MLLDRGAPVDARSTNAMANTALHAALAGRHPAVAALLLARGADVNARQRGGFTALQAAAQHGDAELATLLLQGGADPSLATDDGRTTLSIATEHGHAEVADLLRADVPRR
jgi:ankyrin repeat protein